MPLQRIVCLLFCCLIIPISGEAGGIKDFWLSLFKKKPVRPSYNVLEGSRIRQGKIALASVKLPPAGYAERNRYILSEVPIPSTKNIPLMLFEPTYAQRMGIEFRYAKAVEDFRAFKKEMDVFLYYDSKLSERRVLAPQEKQYMLSKCAAIKAQLRSLLPALADKAFLNFALDYVTHVKDRVVPDMQGLWDDANLASDKVRGFRTEEFFLTTSPMLKDFAELPPLPKGLKIAVLNDSSSLLLAMKNLNKKGIFLPTSEIYVFENPQDLVDALRTSTVKFDVLFLDIIIPGGGGFYVAQMARNYYFEGPIIALTAFEETEAVGKKLFKGGFDGMISTEADPKFDWRRDIEKALANYYFYKKIYGW